MDFVHFILSAVIYGSLEYFLYFPHSGFRDSDFDRVIGTFQNATNFITK